MVDEQGRRKSQHVEVTVSDRAEFSALRAWLKRVPAVETFQFAGTPGPGEQGMWDVLTVFASSAGGLAIAVRSLPEFIRSRRSSVVMTVKVAGKEVTLEATNVDDELPVIESLINKMFDEDES